MRCQPDALPICAAATRNPDVLLQEKYSKICQEERETYSLEEVKCYLTYVKKEIHPVLSHEAC